MESGMGMGIGMDRPAPGAGTRSPDDLKDKAQALGDTARGRAMATLDSNKDQLCAAIEKAADAMKDDPYGRHAADYARRGAEYLRSHSADEMLSTARSELRHRPGVVLGACFVAGLAFSRLLKD